MSSELLTHRMEVKEHQSKPKIIIPKNKNYEELFNEAQEKNTILEVELAKKNQEIEELKLSLSNLAKKQHNIENMSIVASNTVLERQCSNDKEFWQGFIISDLDLLKKPIEYLLAQFGTKEPCNRFDVGNSIEFIICDYIKSCGFQVSELPNAKRFDIDIEHYKKLSIKYSSTGDITLHNSNSCINKDIEMKDTFLLTPDKFYLLTNSELCKNEININDYIKNSGDSLKLKRKILTELEKKNYPFIYDINITHNKKECKNRLCSKIFYSKFMEEYLQLEEES